MEIGKRIRVPECLYVWRVVGLQTEKKAMMPVEVRAQLTDALRLDLVGPGEVLGADGHVLGDASEILPQRP